MKTYFFASVLVIFALGANLFGQAAMKSDAPWAVTAATKTQFFPLSQLKEGMKGTAWTVFRGSEPEEFQVEILGVVPGAVGPKQDMIVGRISGGGADRTSVFAGMSGSPVYIDGKLVGAIAYSFPFSKEPICGITPGVTAVSINPRAERRINWKPVQTMFRATRIAIIGSSASQPVKLTTEIPRTTPIEVHTSVSKCRPSASRIIE
jgi:hypothetical protein